MKAIRVKEFGGPSVMQHEELPDLVPGADQVLLDVRAVGVNPVDTYIRAGTHYKPELPFTPGMDAAGVIKALGREVKKFTVGDRVYATGTLSGSYAEEALCRRQQIHLLPEEISFEQGAAIGIPYATAYRALFNKAKATARETVLIHGASGGVGVAALQLAKLLI